MKVEVAVLGSPCLTVLNKVSVDVKQHWKEKKTVTCVTPNPTPPDSLTRSLRRVHVEK